MPLDCVIIVPVKELIDSEAGGSLPCPLDTETGSDIYCMDPEGNDLHGCRLDTEPKILILNRIFFIFIVDNCLLILFVLLFVAPFFQKSQKISINNFFYHRAAEAFKTIARAIIKVEHTGVKMVYWGYLY